MIEPYKPRQARHELQHVRQAAIANTERITSVAEVATHAFIKAVEVRGVEAQAVALDPGGAHIYGMFTMTAALTMNQAISRAGR